MSQQSRRALFTFEQYKSGGFETHLDITFRALAAQGCEIYCVSGQDFGRSDHRGAVRAYTHADFQTFTGSSVLRLSRIIAEVVERRGIEFVHAHPYLSLVPSALGSVLAGVPYIVTFHAPPDLPAFASHFGAFFHHAVSRFVLPRAAAITAVSEETRDGIASSFCVSPARIQVLRNPIDCEEFRDAAAQAGPHRSPLALLVSRLDDDKIRSVLATLELFRRLRDLDARWVFRVVGDGSGAASVRARARELELTEVEWIGALPSVTDLICGSDVVVGMGRVMLEAFAARRIAVLAGTDGLVGVVHPRQFEELQRANFSGRYVPPADASDVAANIERILQSGGYRCEELFSLVQSQHASGLIAAQARRIYEEAIVGQRKDVAKNEVADIIQWLATVGGRSLRNLEWTATPGPIPPALVGPPAETVALIEICRGRQQAEADLRQTGVEAEQLRGRLADLEAVLEDARAEARRSAAELEHSQDELRKKHVEIDCIRSECQHDVAEAQRQCESRTAEAQRQAATLAEKLGEERIQTAELAAQTEQQSEQIGTLQQQIAELHSLFRNAQAQLAQRRLDIAVRRRVHTFLDFCQRHTPEAVRRRVRPLYLKAYYRVFPQGRSFFSAPLGALPTPVSSLTRAVAPVTPSQLTIRAVPYTDNFTTGASVYASYRPKISVVLPVWNHADLLPSAVKSVLDQTYGNFELIIVDDGSTVDLTPVLEQSGGDPRIRFVRRHHAGLPATLSAGFRHATGDFFTWTSADNVLHPTMFERLLDFLLRHPNVDMTYGNQDLIDQDGRPLVNSQYRVTAQRPDATNKLDLPRTVQTLGLVNDNFIGACFLYRAEAGRIIGPYDRALLGTEDYDYWLRVSLIGSIQHVDYSEPLYSYRVHDDSISGRATPRIAQNAIELIEFHRKRKQFHHRSFRVLIGIDETNPRLQKTADAIGDALRRSGHDTEVMDARRQDEPARWIRDAVDRGADSKSLVLWISDTPPPSLSDLVKREHTGNAFFCWALSNGSPRTIEGVPSELTWFLFTSLERVGSLPPALSDNWQLVTASRFSVEEELALALKARDNVSPLWDVPTSQQTPLVIYLGPLDPRWLDFDAIASLATAVDCTLVFISNTDSCVTDPRPRISGTAGMIFLGYKQVSEWHCYLSRAALLIAPFRAEEGVEEHLPDVMLTYLLAGKPILATEAIRTIGFSDAPNVVVCPPGEFGASARTAMEMRCDTDISDAYLERKSPKWAARRIVDVANTRLSFHRFRAAENRDEPDGAPAHVHGGRDLPSCLLETRSLHRGGLERVIAELAYALRSKGYPVAISVSGHAGDIAQECRRNGISVHMTGDSPEALRKVLEQERIDVLMPHYSNVGTKTAWRCGVPNLSVIHNSYLWSDPAEDAEIKQADGFVSHYISVSSAAKAYFCRKYGVDPSKVTTVPNGINTTACAGALRERPEITRSSLGLGPSDIVLLCVASIIGTKAQIHAVAALHSLAHKFPRLRLLLLGPASDVRYDLAVKDAIRELGLKDHVRICGQTDRVYDYYRLADAFLLSSLTEGWSIAKTEAMFFGLPLILTDVGGAAEVVENEDIGILVPPAYEDPLTVIQADLWNLCTTRTPRNLAALSEAIERFCLGRENWREKARAGTAKVEAKFTSELVVSGYIDQIERIVARQGRRMPKGLSAGTS